MFAGVNIGMRLELTFVESLMYSHYKFTILTSNLRKGLKQISKINLLGKLIGQLNKNTDSDFYTVSYKDFKNTDPNDIKTFAIGNKETVKQYRDIMLAMVTNKTNEKNMVTHFADFSASL